MSSDFFALIFGMNYVNGIVQEITSIMRIKSNNPAAEQMRFNKVYPVSILISLPLCFKGSTS